MSGGIAEGVYEALRTAGLDRPSRPPSGWSRATARWTRPWRPRSRPVTSPPPSAAPLAVERDADRRVALVNELLAVLDAATSGWLTASSSSSP